MHEEKFGLGEMEKIARISQEFRQMLKKSDVFALFSSSRRPDHSKLDKEVEQFEKWIADEHAKDRRLLLEASGK